MKTILTYGTYDLLHFGHRFLPVRRGLLSFMGRMSADLRHPDRPNPTQGLTVFAHRFQNRRHPAIPHVFRRHVNAWIRPCSACLRHGRGASGRIDCVCRKPRLPPKQRGFPPQRKSQATESVGINRRGERPRATARSDAETRG